MNVGSMFKLNNYTRSLRGNYFRKSLIFALIITSLPTAIIGISTYFIGIKQVEKEVYQKNQYQLEQVFKRFDQQFSQLEMTVDKGAANSLFDENLRDINFIDEFRVIQDIYRLLAVAQSSDAMIMRIDLYLENQQLLVSNDRGAIRLKDEPNQSAYASILKSGELMYWADAESYSPSGGSLFPQVLIHKLPFVSTRPYGALLVYLDKNLIDKEITHLTPYEDGISFIMKPNGDWITSGKESDSARQPLKDFIKSKVMKNEINSDSFTVKWEGAEYSVATATFSRTGWRYVIATPLSQLVEPITLTSKLMLGVSMLGVLIAALLSWFASQRMYSPIKRLVQMFGGNISSKMQDEDRSDEIKYIENKWLNITRESQLFQSLLEENRYSMKKGFLLQLIQGQLYFFSEKELRERMEVHGWDTVDKKFALLLIQLSPFSETSKRFVEGDEQLVTFAAANIIEELSTDKVNMETINLHNLTVSLLVSFEQDKPKEQIKSELFRFSNEVITMITKLLGVHVAVGISRPVHELKELPKALDEVKQCLHFRNIGEHGQILSTDDFISYVKENLDYPYQIEKEFIHALQMRAEAETIQKWNEFMLVLTQNAGKAFQIQQYMAQLLGSVLRAMMQLDVAHASAKQGINLYEQLFKLKEIDEINKWFVNVVIHPFLQTLSEKQGIEMKQTIRKVKDIIDQEYMRDISLEYLSDKIGILPKRLSAVFAEVTNQNFIDYVTEVRLEKSKQLLRNTDLKVTEIAARVGYQPSYFNKLFKKSEGMTPGEYRESGLGL
ncbi:helix-turn-helix domain-containing protein [Paenibacillus sp. WQ 127069]|uniref:Helix-turn-helix domain-containing protein n=1 Tax=Paenibacillus baimaensis TaxID=2982185 RepID=A0ABT2UEG4_9BACL|nr:helix-turn-helix domain-containing protein [Paenibacillus sp. WQ 127069]MCU6793034.1 helix-turn-helix domain-containing protein [Paenibacillus sp. WQ 127069]